MHSFLLTHNIWVTRDCNLFQKPVEGSRGMTEVKKLILGKIAILLIAILLIDKHN